ncbi:MAG: ABC transporter permease [Acidimicrobiales bacterium]
MELTGALVRRDLGRRWRSWLAVVLLLGVAGGVAIGAVAGWRRTTSAMDRFLEYHVAPNAYAEGALSREDLLAIDGVEAANGGDYFLLVPVDRSGRPHPEHLGYVSPFSYTDPGLGRTTERSIMVEGDLPDPAAADEVLVDEEMADLYDLHAGDELTVRGYGPDQLEQLFDGLGKLTPTGPQLRLRVTGIQRTPQDVVPKQKVPEVVYLGSAEIHLGPAFDAAHRRQDILSIGALPGGLRPVGSEDFELRLDLHETTRDEVTAAVRELDPDAQLDFEGGDAARARAEAQRTIQMQGGLLLAFGGLVAVGGLILVVLALRRQLEADRVVQRSLWVLGMPGRRAIWSAAVKGIVVGLASAAVALGVATAISPAMPVGHARRAEVHPGVSIDRLVFAAGAALVVLLVVLVVAGTARSEAIAITRRRAPRLPRVGAADRAARAGLSPPVVAGVRSALSGPGWSTAVVTVFLAATGIVGALGYAASETRLATTPPLWGWDFDVVVGDGNDPTVDEHIEASLAGNRDIAAYAKRYDLSSASIAHGDTTVEGDVSAIEQVAGRFDLRLLDGRAPAGEREVALGAATARRLGVGVGDTVDVEHELGTVPMEVSGLAVMNLGLGAERIGEGAVVDAAAIPRLIDPDHLDPPFVMVRYASGTDPAAAYEALHAVWGNTVLRATPAMDVDQLHDVRFLPVWFAALLAMVAVVTLAFVLVLTVRRGRHDLALLRTLGFGRRQVRAAVLTQAITLVLPAALIGIVVGVAAGRVAWSLTTHSLGAPSVQVTPVGAAVAVLAGALVVGWLASAIPARLAARVRPAEVLRTE